MQTILHYRALKENKERDKSQIPSQNGTDKAEKDMCRLLYAVSRQNRRCVNLCCEYRHTLVQFPAPTSSLSPSPFPCMLLYFASLPTNCNTLKCVHTYTDLDSSPCCYLFSLTTSNISVLWALSLTQCFCDKRQTKWTDMRCSALPWDTR